MYRKIAVAFDESPEADIAFRKSLDLARLLGSDVTLITAVESLPPYLGYVADASPDIPQLLAQKQHTFYTDLHARARAAADAAGIRVHSLILEGDEIESLLDGTRKAAPDLLLVGLRLNPTGLSRLVGGTAHKLALHARCDVLGVRPGA